MPCGPVLGGALLAGSGDGLGAMVLGALWLVVSSLVLVGMLLAALPRVCLPLLWFLVGVGLLGGTSVNAHPLLLTALGEAESCQVAEVTISGGRGTYDHRYRMRCAGGATVTYTDHASNQVTRYRQGDRVTLVHDPRGFLDPCRRSGSRSPVAG